MNKIPSIMLGWIWYCLLSSSVQGWAQSAPINIQHQVITLANTYELGEKDYRSLRLHLEKISIPSTLILNGDVIVGNNKHQDDSLTLEQLARLVRGLPNIKMVILPGDRDWNDSGKYGWKRVRKLEKLTRSMKLPNMVWPIKNGCPGPVTIALEEHLLLVAIQTQWWNHPYDKPDPADADCKIASEDNFNEELVDIIEENEDKNILIAGHFPIVSYGPYGGKWPLHKYLVPIPVLGGLIPSFRSNVGTPKDINSYNFKHFRQELAQVLLEQDNLIYLSGHEHNLQILKAEDHYLINSGSLRNPSYAGRGKRAVYSEAKNGIIVLQYFDDGKVKANVQFLVDGGFKKNREFVLFQSACDTSLKATPINTRFVPCKELNDEDDMPKPALGTQTLAAGSEYKASKFKESWWGKHYRDSWTTQVTIPRLNLDTTFQGLVPYQKGGGRQTTSLKFKAGNGGEYVFRSVNKDPAKALDFELRETIVGTVVRDQTSTQQPYGALVVDKLLDNLDLLHAQPKLYVLPNDNNLGVFKESYQGLFGMLEERPTNPDKVDLPFADADEIFKSYKMFRALYDDHDNRIDSKEFVRARVFDLLVGDWGKHEDNWKWAGYESKGGMLFRPIPRDRDHVFSLWDGFFPWLADREWAKTSAANFGYDFKGIRSLMWQARHLDRFLLSELTREDWKEASQFIQDRIDEQVIQDAVRNMPNEIWETDGKEIAAKLEHRLKNLDQAAMEYYDLLAKYVDVVGSNKKEHFSAVRNSDGSVEVAIFDQDETGQPDSTRKYYQRRFSPSETKEIRLYGLQKADKFRITGEAKNSIKIRAIGGPGADDIIDDSEVGGIGKHTLIYEKSSDAKIDLGSEGRRVNHWNNSVYNYNRTDFTYNTYFPLAMILYSADIGLGASVGVQFTRQKFGKKDYASRHSLRLAASTENINIFNYDARFHHVFGRWDVTMGGLVADHFYFTYFFGLGNDSEKDQDLFDADYYRTSYSSYQLNLGLVHDFWEGNQSQFGIKLHYENNAGQIDEDTFLSDSENPQEFLGTDNTNIWEALVHLDLDFRDRKSLPEKGMRAFVQHESGLVTTNGNNDFGITQAYLEGYVSAYLRRPVTLGLKFGGSRSYGEVPFYKLKYLGQRNNLRGFLRNRFTGKSTIFLNSELRWELAEFKTTFFPLRFGLKAFYDTGRIYSDFDQTDNWHSGYGGGFYLIPLKEDISINVSVAFSDEESGLLLVGIGKAF